jgi:hypothetical protein
MFADELVGALSDMREKIQRDIDTHVKEFKQRTGLTPSGIHIAMLEITMMGDRIRQHTVGRVSIDLGEF